MARWPASVRARLTLWYALVLIVPLVIFAATSYLLLERTLLHRTDHFLTESLNAFLAALEDEQREAQGAEITTATSVQEALKDFQFRDMRFSVFDSSGALLTNGLLADSATANGIATLPASKEEQPAEGGPGEATPNAELPLAWERLEASVHRHASGAPVMLTLDDAEGGYRIRVESRVVQGTLLRVAVVLPLHDLHETMEQVATAYLIAIPLLVAAAAAGGYFLAKRSLSPVAAMSARAAEISATNLHARLPVLNRHDELGVLASLVNGLLERLEQAFTQQRRFMADASHELRTPVAILRTEASVTLARPHRSEDEYRGSVGVMQDAARQLGRVVDDLFLLARADAGNQPLRHEALYLEEVVDEVARGVSGLAQQREVRLEVRPLIDAPFRGDADLLGRLLMNLVDNAIKHSPRGGAVVLALAQRDDAYEIRVTDEGPGIPVEAQARIFDRFFRVDRARSRADASESSGAGLGLAIANWVAQAHGGRVELVRSDQEGSEFCVTLPVVAPDFRMPKGDGP